MLRNIPSCGFDWSLIMLLHPVVGTRNEWNYILCLISTNLNIQILRTIASSNIRLNHPNISVLYFTKFILVPVEWASPSARQSMVLYIHNYSGTRNLKWSLFLTSTSYHHSHLFAATTHFNHLWLAQMWNNISGFLISSWLATKTRPIHSTSCYMLSTKHYQLHC